MTLEATSQSKISAQVDARKERLIAAASQLLSEQGIAAASARSIAALAEASPSAINYNFGSLERLLSITFERGLVETRAWTAARAEEIAALPPTADGAIRALEHVVQAWTSDARSLALLYQEWISTGPAQADWTHVWRDFWLEAARGFGLGEAEGRLMHLFFESEALYHLSTWSPALERAVLSELAETFGAIWLGAGARPAIGALPTAERRAGARPHGSVAPGALRIALAAAEIVEKDGLPSLTHRAVAAQAGVTTGAVTHHFRSIEDLVAGAIRGQVQIQSQPPGSPPAEAAPDSATPPPGIETLKTAEEFFDALRGHALTASSTSPVVRRRRLFLAAVRRPELAGAAAVIRYSLGGTSREALHRILGVPTEVLALQAGLISRLFSAIWFAQAPARPGDNACAVLADEILTRYAASLGR